MTNKSYKYAEANGVCNWMGKTYKEKLFRIELRGLGYELGVLAKVNEDKWTIEIVRDNGR